MNMRHPEELDAQDMSRLEAGEDAALNRLMERHAGKLYNYLVRCLQNEDDAADLAQETFVKVYRNCTWYNPSQKFTTWLYAIATNLVKDRCRWRTRHPQISLDAGNGQPDTAFRDILPDQAPLPHERLQAEERTETIRRAVAALPEELRQALVLYEYEDRGHTEIAGILGCSAKAVETRIYRARQQLRSALARLLERASSRF